MKIKRSELKQTARRALLGNYPVMAAAFLISYGISFVVNMIAQVPLYLLLRRNLPFSGTRLFVYTPAAGRRDSLIAAVCMVLLLVSWLCMSFLTALFTAGCIKMYFGICTRGRTDVKDFFWAFTHKPWKFILLYLIALGAVLILLVPVVILIAAAACTGDTRFAAVFLPVYSLIVAVCLFYAGLTFSFSFHVLVEDPQKGIIRALLESRELLIGNRCRFLMLSLSFTGMILLASLSMGIGMIWVAPYIGCTFTLFYLNLRSSAAGYSSAGYSDK